MRIRRLGVGGTLGVVLCALAVLAFTASVAEACATCAACKAKRKAAAAKAAAAKASAATPAATPAACPMAGCGGGACGAATCSACSAAAKPAAKADKGEAHIHDTDLALGTAALGVLIRAKAPLVLLDARAGKWDDGQRIAGAKAVNAKTSPDVIAAVVGGKDKLVVTYCVNLKCPASARLSAQLRKLGYQNVLEYPAGIQGWRQGGGKTFAAVHPKCVQTIAAALESGDFSGVSACKKTRATLEALTLAKADFPPKCRAKVLAAVKSGDFAGVAKCSTTKDQIRGALEAHQVASAK